MVVLNFQTRWLNLYNIISLNEICIQLIMFVFLHVFIGYKLVLLKITKMKWILCLCAPCIIKCPEMFTDK